MTLDIIVPRYNEPWDTCQYLFDTIKNQEIIPFENIKVIMVNDGDDDPLPDTFFSLYPFMTDYWVKDHGGVSDTRNAGLMQATGDYVMFCDVDDGFLNNLAFYMIFSAMAEEPDMIVSSFVEETFDENLNPIVVAHNHDYTFVHGKVYKRQFLIDNNIMFDPSMTIHEDGYFNTLAYSVANKTGKVKYLESPFYLWRWNPNSTVRKDREDFTLKTYDHLMKARIGICDELYRRGYENEARISVGMTVLNSYYDFQKTMYTQPKNKELKEKAEKAFKEFWTKYKKVFYDLDNIQVAQMAVTARAIAVNKGMLFEQQDLKSFLRHIDREVK